MLLLAGCLNNANIQPAGWVMHADRKVPRHVLLKLGLLSCVGQGMNSITQRYCGNTVVNSK